MPMMVAEFTMINYLMLDIPLEHTLEEFGSEMLRRIEEVLRTYEDCYDHDDRVAEAPRIQYATPYNNMVMAHMPLWNEVVIGAIQSPPILHEKFAQDAPRLLAAEFIYSKW